jgi:hypothetical protein
MAAAADRWRREAATRSAMAHDASLVSSASARLVRMIGTFAPRRSRGVGAGEERQALGQHVAGFEVGHDSTLARPATGEAIFLIARPRADRIVERQRAVEHRAGDLAAVGHLAQAAASSVEGTSG